MIEKSLRIHILITGRVQGVGFRYFVKNKCDELKIYGWTRNLGEDQVEILAEGSHTNLIYLIDIVKIGPPSSFVSNVHVDWLEPEDKYSSFQIMPSG